MYHKAVVFGVFDRFHKGHEYFLDQAAELCKELILVLTLPEMSQAFKNKLPKHTYEERFRAIKTHNSTLTIVPGDAIIGVWTVFKTHKPDIVILGYDQQGIAHELEKMNISFMFLDAYFPDKYKTSLL